MSSYIDLLYRIRSPRESIGAYPIRSLFDKLREIKLHSSFNDVESIFRPSLVMPLSAILIIEIILLISSKLVSS